MMSRHILLLPVVLLLFALTSASGQSGITDKIDADHDRAPSVAVLEREAAKAAAEGDDYTAMIYYSRILESDSLHGAALIGYGDAAMRFSAFEKAEMAYQRLVDHKMTTPDGMTLVKLAEAKFRLGKYMEAKELYRRFLFLETPVGITQDVLENAQAGLENCDWALDVSENSDLQAPLDTLKDINTEYSEYAPYPKGDTLYYSSYRFPFTKDKHFPKRHLIKELFAIPQADTLASQLVDFNEENLHTTQATFNEKGDVMYYSICRFISAADIQCELYMRKLKNTNEWGPAVKLPAHINMPGYTNTEPNIGRALGETTETLYFVSDRPGGTGKRDIWYSKIQNDSFAQPVNLKALNTKGNDVTPFYHNGTGLLYFSSDGLQSVGGFDIYRSKGKGDDWDVPAHMGMPINSGGNDVYFALSKNGKTSFFASNRYGSQNISEEACCYDIFKADLVKPEMIAVTFNKTTGDSLNNTVLQLVEFTKKGASEELKVKVPGTYFGFPLQPRRSYMIIATKPRFASDTLRFETPPTIWKDLLVKKLYLKPATPNLVVTVYDKETGEPIPGSTSKFVTIGRVLPGGTLASGKGGGPLDVLTAQHPDTHKFDYPLDFDHHYKVVVSKPGYTIDSTETIMTEGLNDAVTIEKKVYLTRGISFAAHTINAATKDTLDGVTYQLFEIEGGNRKDEYTSPIGSKDYQTTLNYERRYMVTAFKDGFSRDTIIFTTKDLPRTDFQKITRELRLRPLTLEAYLPIKLFFDNDEPDKRTMKTSTNRDYRPTYVDYYRRKPEFLEHWTEGLSDGALTAAQDSMDVFFERDVRGGWERLFSFSEVLYEMMTRGDYIVLTLKGFASPRAASQYNLNLTSRRVSSVYNHFLIFDGGIYKKFVDNGQIIIKLEPNGEKKAPKDISDNIKEERKSIYDPRASRERRLEIIGVEVSRGKKI
ncbi:MAG: PD40 domain-containing protein [Saprospiraceae bacterium]|nr:PD40 domain-containing protein [Saprospiraceae bacterium]